MLDDSLRLLPSKNVKTVQHKMEPSVQHALDEPTRSLFDYSNVMTMVVGKGVNKHYFAFDIPRLCKESPYFSERLLGNYREARERHINFGNINPHTVACMLYWFQGWDCSYCATDAHHIIGAYVLAEKYCVPRFKIHLVQRMQELLRNPASNVLALGCIVHLCRVLKDDCILLDCVVELFDRNDPTYFVARISGDKDAGMKHLRDLLAMEGKRASELKTLLGIANHEPNAGYD